MNQFKDFINNFKKSPQRPNLNVNWKFWLSAFAVFILTVAFSWAFGFIALGYAVYRFYKTKKYRYVAWFILAMFVMVSASNTQSDIRKTSEKKQETTVSSNSSESSSSSSSTDSSSVSTWSSSSSSSSASSAPPPPPPASSSQAPAPAPVEPPKKVKSTEPTVQGGGTVAADGYVFVSRTNHYFTMVQNPGNFSYMTLGSAQNQGAERGKANQHAR